jgi:hypothetical protein
MKREYFKSKTQTEEKRQRDKIKSRKARVKLERELLASRTRVGNIDGLSKVLAAQVLTEQQIKDKMLEYDFASLIEK